MPSVHRQDGLRPEIQLLHGARREDRVARVRRLQQYVGIGGLEPLHLARQVGGLRVVRDVGRDLVPMLLRVLLLQLAHVGAEQRVLVEKSDALHRSPALLQLVEELEEVLAELLVRRRCAKEPAEAARREERRGRFAGQKRDPQPLGGLTRGRGDVRVVCAEQRDDLLLRHQPLRLRQPFLR